MIKKKLRTKKSNIAFPYQFVAVKGQVTKPARVSCLPAANISGKTSKELRIRGNDEGPQDQGAQVDTA